MRQTPSMRRCLYMRARYKSQEDLALAPITSSIPDDDDEDFIEDVEDDDEELEQVNAPAVSDRRRRRQMKRGETVSEVVAQATRKDRPTPSQRPEAARSKNFVVRFFQNTREYFLETKTELGKVVWLPREELLRLSYIVIMVTAISAIFLGTVSYIFGLLTQALTTNTIVAGPRQDRSDNVR